MIIEIVKEVVDFLFEYFYDSEKIVIGFYGGEFLLRFDFIKEIVLYV